jgi:pimeloyl-ACP methyl ester carboxylesterase
MNGQIEPIVGRYVHVDIGGVTHRIYFEENGSGIPLVCLHTAGSDNRQWRHLLCDGELTKHYRIIAFDMPWHGKSNPPDDGPSGEYQLTTASYTQAIRAFCAALSLERPGGDGMLDRRPHRAEPCDRSCSRIPCADRA